ncbi:MAG: hypothetical protein HRT94_06235 [Alphaproteobacteria bacterium]|nr:hypothetical protein [Alphaproteobacteria bacterium]
MDHDGNIYKNVSTSKSRAGRVLGGIGKHDIILSAKMRTVRKPQKTLVHKTPFQTTREYVDMAAKFIEENHYRDKERLDKLDVWYGDWNAHGSWVFRGQHIYDDTIVNPFVQNDAIIKDDFRQFRKEETDRWFFGKPYKYHIWSDHSVYLEYLEKQIDHALELKAEAERIGGDAPLYCLIVKARAFKPGQVDFKGDYMFSVGLYANFLEEHADEMDAFSKMQIEYSKVSQLEREAVPYLSGWYWENDEVKQ